MYAASFFFVTTRTEGGVKLLDLQRLKRWFEVKSHISHINDSLIQRPRGLVTTRQALKRSPVVALFCPRRFGKTTLAHPSTGADRHFFDLESSLDRQALSVVA